MKPQQHHIDKAREVWGEIMSTDTNAISIIATALAQAALRWRAMDEPREPRRHYLFRWKNGTCDVGFQMPDGIHGVRQRTAPVGWMPIPEGV